MRRLVAVVLLVASCSAPSGSPSTSAAPTASPAVTPGLVTSVPVTPAPATGAPSPSPSQGAAFAVLWPGSAIEVAVSELNLRARPSTSARRIETLKRGDILIVSPLDTIWLGVGPVRRNGYTWYPVMKLQVPGPDGKLPPLPTYPIVIGSEVIAGWLATDDGTRRYVADVRPRCPLTTIDLQTLQGMLPGERLACIADPVVLEGTFGCNGCGGAVVGSYEPSWLADPLAYDYLSVDVPEQFGPIALHFRPEGPARPTPGSIIRVTAHIEDPASSQCRMSMLNNAGELEPLPTDTVIAYCRERIVVDSYEVIGTDPDFNT